MLTSTNDHAPAPNNFSFNVNTVTLLNAVPPQRLMYRSTQLGWAMERTQKLNRATADKLFQVVDDAIYGIVGLFLIASALLTLYSVAQSLLDYFHDEDARHAVVIILDKIMLTLMIIEILYTVRVSLQQHSLSAEPFLIVGLIAAIRRILVISVESGYMITVNQDGFLNLLIEIGILGILVLFFVWAIILLRRQEKEK